MINSHIYKNSNNFGYFYRKQSTKQKISSIMAEKKFGYYYKEFFDEIRETRALRKPRKR